MSTNKNPDYVADDVVVSLEYRLTVEGEMIDSSEESGPIEFLQGRGNIITGLEKELYGLKIGDSKKVTVQPKDGYGDVDPEAFMEVPRGEFPPDIPLEKGVELEMQDEDEEIVMAVIDRVTRDSVRLNFNHPLAGKVLAFDVQVSGLREATEEELAHGHVHGDEEDEEGYIYEDIEEEEYEDEDEGDDESGMNNHRK